MRNTRLVLMVLAALFALPALSSSTSKSQPEFEHMKLLAGDWTGKTSNGTMIRYNYKIVSAGSAVMESIDEGGSQMVTLYYLDGDRLMLTHFCSANNQPRMQSDAATSTPDAIKFTFVDVTNLPSPDAGHMQGHVLTWKDANHIIQQWTWREKGQERVESFELHRGK